MSSFVMVFCEIGARPAARTAEIMTRSRRWTGVLSARAESRLARVDVIWAPSRPEVPIEMTGASAIAEILRLRRFSAGDGRNCMCDSLRRYEPDQVLRDSLSLRPTWAGT